MNKNYIIDEITAELGDVKVAFIEVEKNGVMKKAIQMQNKSHISHVFYYNPDDNDDKIIDLVVDNYAEFANPNINADKLSDNFKNWDWVKTRVYPRLFNANKGNSVNDVANYVLAGDINVGFYILLSSDKESDMTIKVRWDMLDKWGISLEVLTETAKSNLNKKLFINSMMNVLFGGGRKEERSIDMSDVMTICTSTNAANGAAAILLLADLIDSGEIDDADYYILPSSIHETILLRDYNDGYKSMVKEVNASVLTPEDFLSDNVLMYDKATKSIKVVA